MSKAPLIPALLASTLCTAGNQDSAPVPLILCASTHTEGHAPPQHRIYRRGGCSGRAPVGRAILGAVLGEPPDGHLPHAGPALAGAALLGVKIGAVDGTPLSIWKGLRGTTAGRAGTAGHRKPAAPDAGRLPGPSLQTSESARHLRRGWTPFCCLPEPGRQRSGVGAPRRSSLHHSPHSLALALRDRVAIGGLDDGAAGAAGWGQQTSAFIKCAAHCECARRVCCSAVATEPPRMAQTALQATRSCRHHLCYHSARAAQ